ncbi:MFS transporter [Amycolatopsis rubida]|uniref:Predicted arabinose efflux permease, MFS family n=1 Tax=Amycolatopsis rubida TaxID=112413 RepID=A0A1I5FX40_9PSEU|nr:MFS transporter [Amycolatopsis rubida]SFO28173.1 Predicted arabinose efflux permease, MFS family [Amycolatopsis rubida]
MDRIPPAPPVSPAGQSSRTAAAKQAKRATHAAFFGFGVDYFDIYLPVVALAPAIHYFQPKGIPDSVETTLFYLTFAATLLGRPVGSIIFGGISDRIGRRNATLIAVAGFTVATFLMAALPGYAQWGYGGIVCLLLLRFVGGIFMGGEYTSANPLALESCPPAKRGIVGAYIAGAYPIGYIAISAVTLPLLSFLPGGGAGSAYQNWGWRLPFFVGGLLGVVFFLFFYRSVDESAAWRAETAREKSATEKKAPLRELLRDRKIRRRLAQAMLLMTGLWFGVQSIISPVSGLLITYLKQNSGAVTTALLVSNVALFLGYLALGHLGQKYGRRRVLICAGIATFLVSVPSFLAMLTLLSTGGSFVLAMALYTVGLVVAISPFGVATVYLIEAFPTKIRASGYGVAYSVSLLIPSFYSFYMLGLSSFMPYLYTPLIMIALGGILTAVGAKIGTETSRAKLLDAAD